MISALRVPLLPAALLVIVIAWLEAQNPPVARSVGVAGCVVSGLLARASVDRPRRLAWAAAAALAGIMAARPLLGPLPEFDLVHAGGLDQLRGSLAFPLRRLVPEPEAGILLGIVLGERASVGPELSAAFARSGTTHLLAISGFNMTLAAAAVALILRGRARPSVIAGATTLAIAGYSVLVGLAPSVLRAAVMGSVTAMGLALGRRAAVANALCAAVAVMIVLSPAVLGDVGFLLSVGATAGLVLFQAPLAARLGRLPTIVRGGLAATLAASIPTVPVIVAVFGRLSLVSPLANVLAVPLFPPLMAAGAVTSVVGLMSLDAARPFAMCAYAIAWALRIVVESSASVPGASVGVPDGVVSGLLAALLTVAAIVVLRRGVAGLRAFGQRVLSALPVRHIGIGARRVGAWRVGARGLGASTSARRARVAAALVAALATGSAAGALAPFGAEAPVRVRALDIGQGDAYLVEVGGHYALIDGGPDPARLLAELGATFPPWHRRLDMIVLTHAHADHGNGLIGLFDRYEIALAIEPAGLNEGPLASAWAAHAASAGVPRRALRVGAQLTLGDARIRTLAPNDDPRVEIPSLVLRLDRGVFSMLFMGDATDQAQAGLLLTPEALATRVYVPPHHGAASPFGAALVAAVRPEAAVLSVGAGNRYGHPTPETLAALAGVATYRTDQDGTVEIQPDGTRLVVHTHANGLPPPRGGSVPYAPSAR